MASSTFSFEVSGRLILRGIRDSVALHRPLLFLLKSQTIRVRSLQCLILNGVIFLGSLFLYDFIISPSLSFLLHLFIKPSSSFFSVVDVLHNSFSVLYQLLWLWPIYSLSFILNTLWYQDIADRAYFLHFGKPQPPRASFSDRMADELYRVVIVGVVLVQIGLVVFIPIVGPMLAFFSLSLLYAFYTFEYIWANQQWRLMQRITFFEENWAYFFGFGFLCTAATFFFPRFSSAGIFALLFPLFILSATPAQPTRVVMIAGKPKESSRLPVFKVTKAVCSFLLTRLLPLPSSPFQ